MGQKRRRARARAGIDRRGFLKAAAAGMAAAAAPLLPRGSSVAQAAATTSVFQHGVASGDPLQDRVMLWTRVSTTDNAPVTVDYVIATDPQLTTLVQTGATITDASRDYTVKLDIGGLEPAHTYYYRFSAAGETSPIGRTRTLPQGAVDRLRIGVAVCASLAHGYFNAYQRLADRSDLDLVIHLGDYIYEYGDGEYGSARGYEPPHEIVSLADYRQRHAQYKREPELQAMHRQHPMIAIWDDHEFANNCWQNGALGHPEYTVAQWQDRVSAALQAYYEWMPTRVPDPGNLRRNYRSFKLGDLADLFMLEERVGARAQQIPPPVIDIKKSGFGAFVEGKAYEDPSRALLGSAEEQWLFDGLRSSSASWKLIGQGVMFAQLKVVGLPNATKLSEYFNNDQWDGYDPVRARVFEVLKGDAAHAPVPDVVVLTGDIHSAWGADLTPDPNKLLGANFGGYDALSGKGSLAVEFVTSSVTSPFPLSNTAINQAIKLNNPHFKYVDVTHHGYTILDITPARISNEWWNVAGIDARGGGESFGAAFQVLRGENHLRKSTQSAAKPNPPAPAP